MTPQDSWSSHLASLVDSRAGQGDRGVRWQRLSNAINESELRELHGALPKSAVGPLARMIYNTYHLNRPHKTYSLSNTAALSDDLKRIERAVPAHLRARTVKPGAYWYAGLPFDFLDSTALSLVSHHRSPGFTSVLPHESEVAMQAPTGPPYVGVWRAYLGPLNLTTGLLAWSELWERILEIKSPSMLPRVKIANCRDDYPRADAIVVYGSRACVNQLTTAPFQWNQEYSAGATSVFAEEKQPGVAVTYEPPSVRRSGRSLGMYHSELVAQDALAPLERV